MTLAATVTSMEDHGYIVDFGIDGLAGFLAHKEVEKVVVGGILDLI